MFSCHLDVFCDVPLSFTRGPLPGLKESASRARASLLMLGSASQGKHRATMGPPRKRLSAASGHECGHEGARALDYDIRICTRSLSVSRLLAARESLPDASGRPPAAHTSMTFCWTPLCSASTEGAPSVSSCFLFCGKRWPVSEVVSGLHHMEIRRLRLHPSWPSILVQYGTGRTPFTNGDGGKEPCYCGKQTSIFLRNDVASVRFGTALWTRLRR